MKKIPSLSFSDLILDLRPHSPYLDTWNISPSVYPVDARAVDFDKILPFTQHKYKCSTSRRNYVPITDLPNTREEHSEHAYLVFFTFGRGATLCQIQNKFRKEAIARLKIKSDSCVLIDNEAADL